MRTRPPWFYRQSAVIPYRVRGEKLEVLLVTSLKRRRWIIPKGIVEPAMAPGESAAKEALEEAGVSGTVGRESLGEYSIEKWGGVCRVEVFPLRVEVELEEWPESGLRERRWVPLEEAAEAVPNPRLKQILASLPRAVAGSGGD